MSDRGKVSGRKQKVTWSLEAEAKVVELWADVLEKYDGKMMTKKNKEKLVTQQLNEYCDRQGVPRFSDVEVKNKIDSVIKKAKAIYSQFRLTRETGRATDDNDVVIDEAAANLAWPNFAVFLARFKNHPSLGPGTVDDAAFLPPGARTGQEEEEEGSAGNACQVTSGGTPSRTPTPSEFQAAHESSTDEETVRTTEPKAKKRKMKSARVGLSSSHRDFVQSMAGLQEDSQRRQFDHETKLQLQLQEFEERREQERRRQDLENRMKEEEMRLRLAHESQAFQANLMQQTQSFQAELFKRLFSSDKDKDKDQ